MMPPPWSGLLSALSKNRSPRSARHGTLYNFGNYYVSACGGVANEIKELDDILRLKKCDARIKDAARWTAETCA